MNRLTQQKPQLSRRNFMGGAAGIATLIATGGGASLLLSGCSTPTAPTGGPSALTGRYMTASGFILNFVEVLVAQEQGFFKEFGLDLDIQGGPNTAGALQALLGNSVEIARTNGVNTTIAIANEDAPLMAIGTVFQQSVFDLCSLAESPIKDPAELAGKRVGIISAGGSTENLLDAMLIQSGVDPDAVSKPVTGVGTAAYELARKGDIDAWISTNNDRFVIDRDLGDLYYFNTDDFAKLPGDTYNVSSSLIESGSEVPTQFLAGVLKAMEFASDEANWPQVVKDLQVYAPDSDTDRSLASMPQLIETWQSPEGFLHIDEETWRSGQDILLKIGSLKKSVPTDKFLYTKYLEAARKL